MGIPPSKADMGHTNRDTWGKERCTPISKHMRMLSHTSKHMRTPTLLLHLLLAPRRHMHIRHNLNSRRANPMLVTDMTLGMAVADLCRLRPPAIPAQPR